MSSTLILVASLENGCRTDFLEVVLVVVLVDALDRGGRCYQMHHDYARRNLAIPPSSDHLVGNPRGPSRASR